MLTWQVLSKIPDVVVVGGALLYGIWWITNRRTKVQEVMAEEAAAKSGPPTGTAMGKGTTP
jgi:hypothetical protein